MRTVNTPPHKRRGIASIMGTLIFVGILFTTVIPLFMVMRQADTFLAKKKLELERLDEERENEDLYLYVFPVGGSTSTNLKVTAQNKGELHVRVVRLWMNDDLVELDNALQPMSGIQELGTFPTSPQSGEAYYFMATTERGNIVSFDTPLTWQDDMSGWITDIFSINVLVTSLPGCEFKIEVIGPSLSEPLGDLTEKFDPKFFIVPVAGTYTVTIYRGTKPIYVEDVTITWPEGPPVEWVFA